MRIFVYEFITGGGMWSVGERPSGSLLAEGAAMREALTRDLAAVPETGIVALCDSRLEPPSSRCEIHRVDSREREQRLLCDLARTSDATIVIAPEFDRHLLDRCRLVEAAGARLLSPDAEFVEIASDKQRTCEQLHRAGVPTAVGRLVEAPHELGQPGKADVPVTFPAVVKPVDGAGSLGVRLLDSPAEAAMIQWRAPMRLESYCPGTAASVAFLCGPRGVLALEPCEQRLSDDGRFRYLGGATPIAAELRERAVSLARRAMAALPATIGYVGVDLVLGHVSDGGGDVVIEVNPRLTTSYIGLSRQCRQNLAKAMLDVAAGHLPTLSFSSDRIEFDVANVAHASPRASGDM